MRRDRLVYCIVLNLKGGVSFLEMFGGGGGGGGGVEGVSFCETSREVGVIFYR